jgi:hypothetical protein
MPMITPDRVMLACREYERQYKSVPRFIYVTPFDWDPLRYLLRDSIDEGGFLHVGTWKLRLAMHHEVPRGQCVVTDKSIPAEYHAARRDDGPGRLRATMTVKYPHSQ